MAAADVKYFVDGIDFATFGVYVSASDGVVCKPAMKVPLSDQWNFNHGTMYDLSEVYCNEATLQLKCFIEANGFDDFITKANGFLSTFADADEHTLLVKVGTMYASRDVSLTVMCMNTVDIDKQWHAGKFVGTFTLKLTVPHPARPSAHKSGTFSNDTVAYSIDGNLFSDYGVYVQASTGITTIPPVREPIAYNWGTADGVDYHQDGVKYKERTIQLKCMMEAPSFTQLTANALAFFGLLTQNRTLRLMIGLGTSQLVYEVICRDQVTLVPDYSSQSKCVGFFTLKLVEPEPVKRVLYGSGTCTITIKSKSPVNIYWGDGSHTFDVSGNDESQTVSHSVSSNYVVITGEPNDFTSFSSNFTTIWSRLI